MAGGGLHRAGSADRAYRATRKPTTWALDELTDRKLVSDRDPAGRRRDRSPLRAVRSACVARHERRRALRLQRAVDDCLIDRSADQRCTRRARPSASRILRWPGIPHGASVSSLACWRE
jgi:hypothetical protein